MALTPVGPIVDVEAMRLAAMWLMGGMAFAVITTLAVLAYRTYTE